MRTPVSLLILWLALAQTVSCEDTRSVRIAEDRLSMHLANVPHLQAEPEFTAAACVAMWLKHLGHDTDADAVQDLISIPLPEGRGLNAEELERALHRIGCTRTREQMIIPDGPRRELTLVEALNRIRTDLHAGVASIVPLRSRPAAGSGVRFLLVLGYDDRKGTVILHDPSLAQASDGGGVYRHVSRERFVSLWPAPGGNGSTRTVRFRLPRAEKLNAPEAQTVFTNADYLRAVAEVKPRLPEGFTLLVEPPFVVIGDESPARVGQRAIRTVRWCAMRLQERYFRKSPPAIYTIWLFKDKASYRKHTKLFFNYTPSTPYGYASSREKALVMNIATGGGTLCHEMVHAYMAGNFPDAPPWFNEGLGSLYEQSSEREGAGEATAHIVGLTNWRLAGLQKAIRAGRLPTFKALCEMDEEAFYGEGSGNHYAQARYLLYYLQETERLHGMYHQFVKNAEDDPSGYKTLQKILDEKDMKAFQERWSKWVLKLRFER